MGDGLGGKNSNKITTIELQEKPAWTRPFRRASWASISWTGRLATRSCGCASPSRSAASRKTGTCRSASTPVRTGPRRKKMPVVAARTELPPHITDRATRTSFDVLFRRGKVTEDQSTRRHFDRTFISAPEKFHLL